jgi:hypothetical protein
MAAAIDRTVQLADSGALRAPEGQPIPVEKFSEAVYLTEAPAHGANRCWCSNRRRQIMSDEPEPTSSLVNGFVNETQ